jgi:hypothetical protein
MNTVKLQIKISLKRVQDPMRLRNLSLRLDLFLVQHDIENMYNWIFKERPKNALGNKMRFVSRIFSQVEGIDYEETFGHVARYTSIRMIISPATSMG